MPSYRVQITNERILTFYVEAERKEDVYGFLEASPEWKPGDVPGLIDVVGDEVEVDYHVALDEKIKPNFRVTAALDLVEVE